MKIFMHENAVSQGTEFEGEWSYRPITPQQRCYEGFRVALENVLRNLGADIRVLRHSKTFSSGSICAQDPGIALTAEGKTPLVLLARMEIKERSSEPGNFVRDLINDQVKYESPPFISSDPLYFEGGDTVFIGDSIFIRRGGRTSNSGIEWIRSMAEPYGYEVVPVDVVEPKKMLTIPFPHLSSIATWAGHNGNRHFIVRNPECLPDVTPFTERGIGVIDVPTDSGEKRYANVLPFANSLIVAKESPVLQARLRKVGFDSIIPIEWSEMANNWIGFTCLCFITNPRRQITVKVSP